MYLLGAVGGLGFQRPLWELLQAGKLHLLEATPADCEQMARSMDQYHDVPMDLADASLIAAAERHGFRRIFSLDTDFYVYRLSDGSILEPVPGPG